MGINSRLNRNLLLRALAVQELYKEYQANGATNEWIYQNVVMHRFYISRATFYRYLSIPAARELKRLETQLQHS
jgi:hypothetical protein